MIAKNFLAAGLGLLIPLLLASAPASAQATRTWVSGVGDDVNPCSRTAPCKTFAGAISKTAAGGEINCLDPGGYGAVTITKAMTISCLYTHGSVLNSGTNGIIINAPATASVILRGLEINGAGNGLDGIRFLAGSQLTVDKCTIFGQTGNGITIQLATGADVYITDTYITTAAKGISATSSAGNVIVSVDRVSINNVGSSAFEANANIIGTITNSSFASAANGVLLSGGSQVNVDSVTMINNGTALNSNVGGSIIRVSNSNLYNNGSNFNIVAGGSILSNGTNRTTASGGTPNPSGSIVLK
jgi:hypothetical protein